MEQTRAVWTHDSLNSLKLARSKSVPVRRNPGSNPAPPVPNLIMDVVAFYGDDDYPMIFHMARPLRLQPARARRVIMEDGENGSTPRRFEPTTPKRMNPPPNRKRKL